MRRSGAMKKLDGKIQSHFHKIDIWIVKSNQLICSEVINLLITYVENSLKICITFASWNGLIGTLLTEKSTFNYGNAIYNILKMFFSLVRVFFLCFCFAAIDAVEQLGFLLKKKWNAISLNILFIAIFHLLFPLSLVGSFLSHFRRSWKTYLKKFLSHRLVWTHKILCLPFLRIPNKILNVVQFAQADRAMWKSIFIGSFLEKRAKKKAFSLFSKTMFACSVSA